MGVWEHLPESSYSMRVYFHGYMCITVSSSTGGWESCIARISDVMYGRLCEGVSRGVIQHLGQWNSVVVYECGMVLPCNRTILSMTVEKTWWLVDMKRAITRELLLSIRVLG